MPSGLLRSLYRLAGEVSRGLLHGFPGACIITGQIKLLFANGDDEEEYAAWTFTENRGS